VVFSNAKKFPGSHRETDHSSENGLDAPAAAEAGHGRDLDIGLFGGEFFAKKLHCAKRGAGVPDLEFFGRSAAEGSEQQHQRDYARLPTPHAHWLHASHPAKASMSTMGKSEPITAVSGTAVFDDRTLAGLVPLFWLVTTLLLTIQPSRLHAIAIIERIGL
jgi:hypothetical protein